LICSAKQEKKSKRGLFAYSTPTIWKSVKKMHIFADVLDEVSYVPVKEVILKLRTVLPDSQLIRAEKAVGTSFGE
jgi:hypothetical protein